MMNFSSLEIIAVFSIGVLCGIYAMYFVASNVIIPITVRRATKKFENVEAGASLTAFGIVLKGLHLGAVESLRDYNDTVCIDVISNVCCRAVNHIDYIHKQLELPENAGYLNNITSLKQIGSLKGTRR